MTKISKKAQPVQMSLMTGDEKIDLEMEEDLMMVVLKLKSREMLDCQKIQYDLLKAEQERMKITQEAHTEKLDQVAKS
nr:hypothetical protein CTI12_AA363680 [Tanacetum cinerariifolium]